MQAQRGPRRWWHPRGWFGRRVEALASSESGQVLVFGAITLFMLAASVIFVADVGMLTSNRIEVQNAADECAYAGVLYEANMASSIAYLNEAMAYLYYDALRYASDTTMLGVLTSVKRYDPAHPAPDPVVYDDYDKPPDPQTAYAGNVEAHYGRAWLRAQRWVPQIEQTLNMLARWEWGMALACNELVKMEIHRSALKHRIEAIAIYPDVDFFPDNGVAFDLHIEKLMEGGEHVGWHVYTDGPPRFEVIARRLGEFHWLITNTAGITYEVWKQNDTTYYIRVTDPTNPNNNQEITCNIIDPNSHIQLVRKDSQDKETRFDARNLPGLGWAVAMSNDDYDVSYVPENGGYRITVTNHRTGTTDSAGIRRDPATGKIQQWTGSGWVDVPGQRDTVTVNGIEISVQIDSRIYLDPPANTTWFNPPNTLHLPGLTYHIPNVVELPDFWVTILPDSVKIDAFIDIQTPNGGRRLRFTIDEKHMDELTVFGCMNVSYVVPDHPRCWWFANRDGTERDRMCRDCQLEDDCGSGDGTETHWTYQFRVGKPYFIREKLERFGHHAICDRDPAAAARYANGDEYFDWTAWYDVGQGKPSAGGEAYYQTRIPWDKAVRPNWPADDPKYVRMRASNNSRLDADPPRTFDPYYQKVNPWGLEGLAESMMKLYRDATPIRLSEDFFFYGLTVGCWRSHKNTKSTPLNLFRNPKWGVVAAASARAGFLERVSDEPADEMPQYRFTWLTANRVEQFVNYDYENLYEPIWTAHLWPITDAIRSDHLRAYEQNQTGLSYLLYGLFHTHWYTPRPPEELGEMPKLREDVPYSLAEMGINVDSPDIGEVIQH